MDLLKAELEQFFATNTKQQEMEIKIRTDNGEIKELEKDIIQLKKEIRAMKDKIPDESTLSPGNDNTNIIEELSIAKAESVMPVSTPKQAATKVVPKVQRIVMANKGDTKELKALNARVSDMEGRILAIEDKGNKMGVNVDKILELSQQIGKKADIIDVKMVQSDLSRQLI